MLSTFLSLSLSSFTLLAHWTDRLLSGPPTHARCQSFEHRSSLPFERPPHGPSITTILRLAFPPVLLSSPCLWEPNGLSSSLAARAALYTAELSCWVRPRANATAPWRLSDGATVRFGVRDVAMRFLPVDAASGRVGAEASAMPPAPTSRTRSRWQRRRQRWRRRQREPRQRERRRERPTLAPVFYVNGRRLLLRGGNWVTSDQVCTQRTLGTDMCTCRCAHVRVCVRAVARSLDA